MIFIGEVVFTGGANLPYPECCKKNTMNQNIAIKLSRIVIEACVEHHPVVPQRGVPLPSLLQTRPVKTKGVVKRYERWFIEHCFPYPRCMLG